MIYEKKIHDLLKNNAVTIGSDTFELLNIGEDDSGSQGDIFTQTIHAF